MSKASNTFKFGQTFLPSEARDYPPNLINLKKFGPDKYGWPGEKVPGEKGKTDIEYQTLDLVEAAWLRFLIDKSPMGKLIKENSTFDLLKKNKGLRIIHVTSSLPEIEGNGQIYASGGALGACIYGVPLRTDNQLHNFSDLFFRYELPNSLKTKGLNKKISLLEIYLHQSNFRDINLPFSGIDYLKFGILRTRAFEQLVQKGIIPPEEARSLQGMTVNKFEKIRDFLEICSEYEVNRITDDTFFKLFFKALNTVNHLRAVYFEVVSEYVLLFQNDSEAWRYFSLGELYHWNHKKMIFDLCPILNQKFKLTYFNPTVKAIINYFEEKSQKRQLITDFSKEHFYQYLKWRTSQYIRLKILDENPLPKSEISFKAIVNSNPSFAGHLIHREVKEIHQYEKEMATIFWKYWNENKLLCLANSILPKGEMGVNPAYPNIKYQIFEGILDQYNKFTRRQELKVKIVPEIINPALGVLRAPHK